MGKVLEFDNWKRFCKYVSNHVLGWTIDEINRIVLNTKLDEMISNINMLCVWFSEFANMIADWLSNRRIVGKIKGLNISLIRWWNQINSLAVWVVPTYSASMVERVTSSCFLDDHDTAPLSTRTTKPEIAHLWSKVHCKTRRVVKSTLNSTKKSCDLSLFLVIFH